jgi:glycerol-3-phosphate acyltransferase PlsX
MNRLAIDAMGGDKAPGIVVEGLKLVSANPDFADVSFTVFGNAGALRLFEEVRPALGDRLLFQECSEVVTGDTEPRLAIRQMKDSTMRQAILAVAEDRADAVVSAGNTGAYMALSKLVLGTIEGIHRPAITSFIPTIGKPVVFLDLGANVDVTPEILMQFCVMGQAFSRVMAKADAPAVALLNVGSESLKGNTIVKDTHNLLQEASVLDNYQGFAEGDDIFKGVLDVVVTDGFTGNIALKTIEGTVRFLTTILKEELQQSPVSKAGAWLAQSAFKSFKHRMDPRIYNGAPFLGLKGISVKSHGGTDGVGFAAALTVALKLHRAQLNTRIQKEVAALQHKLAMVI